MQAPLQPSIPPKRSRPLYLVVALVVGWTIGIGGVMSGCGLLQFYREPTQKVEVHEPTDEGLGAYLAEQQKASQEASAKALNESHGRMVPLAVANMLLSGLLILACARALAAKPKAHLLALQAVAANILYTVVDYFISAPVREAVIRAAASGPSPTPDTQLDPNQLASAVAWSFRFIASAQLIVLGLIAYALTRPRVVAFFQPDDEDPKGAES